MSRPPRSRPRPHGRDGRLVVINMHCQVSYDHRSYERNLTNCVQKHEKVRISTGFEPVTSRYRCDALTNWALKPLTLGASYLWFLTMCWYCRKKQIEWCLALSILLSTTIRVITVVKICCGLPRLCLVSPQLLRWRIWLSIRVQKTLNHIRFG